MMISDDAECILAYHSLSTPKIEIYSRRDKQSRIFIFRPSHSSTEIKSIYETMISQNDESLCPNAYFFIIKRTFCLLSPLSFIRRVKRRGRCFSIKNFFRFTFSSLPFTFTYCQCCSHFGLRRDLFL